MASLTINNIDDNGILFYRIPRGIFAPNFDFDDIPLHAFNPSGTYISVNWQEYCETPDECLAIPTPTYPNGRTNKTHGVGHFIAGIVRKIEPLEVEHKPTSHYSHSGIINVPAKDDEEPFLETKVQLKRIFKTWNIKPIHKE